MYRLTKESEILSDAIVTKLVAGYVLVTFMCLGIPYFNKYLIDYAMNNDRQISFQTLILILFSIIFIQLFIFYFGNYAAIEKLKNWISSNKSDKLIIAIFHENIFDNISDEIYAIEGSRLNKL